MLFDFFNYLNVSQQHVFWCDHTSGKGSIPGTLEIISSVKYYCLLLVVLHCLTSGAYFQVLKGIPDKPEVVLVKLREIKNKIERRTNAQDRYRNTVSMKDIVRVLEGPSKVTFLIIAA